MAKAHRSAQNSHPGNPLLPRLENNGLVKEMLTEPIISPMTMRSNAAFSPPASAPSIRVRVSD
jgi:hypothetical protein